MRLKLKCPSLACGESGWGGDREWEARASPWAKRSQGCCRRHKCSGFACLSPSPLAAPAGPVRLAGAPAAELILLSWLLQLEAITAVGREEGMCSKHSWKQQGKREGWKERHTLLSRAGFGTAVAGGTIGQDGKAEGGGGEKNVGTCGGRWGGESPG